METEQEIMFKSIFIHSYHYKHKNWKEVVFGHGEASGRLTVVNHFARTLNIPFYYSIGNDAETSKCFERNGGLSIGLAINTRTEAEDLSKFLQEKRIQTPVLIVSSCDHIPRCVRDHLLANPANAQIMFFFASDVPYSSESIKGVKVIEKCNI